MFFNWASLLIWSNYPKHFRVGIAIWWSSVQMMLTLKLEGQPYGEVKNKICWPSESSYQPPNGSEADNDASDSSKWRQIAEVPWLWIVFSIHFCLSLFSVLGSLDCANLGGTSQMQPQRSSSHLHIHIWNKIFYDLSIKYTQKSENKCFLQVSSF